MWIDFNFIFVVYDPGCSGSFLSGLCEQIICKETMYTLSRYGNAHSRSKPPIGWEDRIKMIPIGDPNIIRVLPSHYYDLPMSKFPGARYINIVNDDPVLSVQLQFIKHIYEEPESKNHLETEYTKKIVKLVRGPNGDRSIKDMNRSDALYLMYLLREQGRYSPLDEPKIETDHCINITFSDIYTGNPSIIPKLEEFIGCSADEQTYTLLEEYAKSQKRPIQFVVDRCSVVPAVGVEPTSKV